MKEAIVRAINRFNDENRHTYLALMKATIGEAIGLSGTSDEVDLLERQIEGLNNKMLEIVNQSIQSGSDIETHEDEFREISEQIEGLKKRIAAMQESASNDESREERLAEIQNIIEQREQNKTEYDDSIVRQMVECIKVYKDKIEVIFGGGYAIEEPITIIQRCPN